MRPQQADVDLVHGLVAIPSLSRHEGEAVEWLVAQLAERGFRATVDDAGNAVGEIGDGAHHVILLGHIDTVPGEIPVRIEGDELVGRGAVDAKGPLAAFVAAATRPPAGVRVTVVGAVEEESPTSAGARYRAALGAPDWCVIGEPSGWDAITVAYKGRLAMRVALARDARHGASPGPTCTEEALGIWERIHDAAETRSAAGSAAAFRLRPDAILAGVRLVGDKIQAGYVGVADVQPLRAVRARTDERAHRACRRSRRSNPTSDCPWPSARTPPRRPEPEPRPDQPFRGRRSFN